MKSALSRIGIDTTRHKSRFRSDNNELFTIVHPEIVPSLPIRNAFGVTRSPLSSGELLGDFQQRCSAPDSRACGPGRWRRNDPVTFVDPSGLTLADRSAGGVTH